MAGNGMVPALFSMALVLFVMSPSVVQAQGQPGGPPGPARDPIAIYRAAGCSPEQEAQIRELAKSFEELARAKGQQVVGLWKDMRNLSLQPDPEPSAIMAKQDEINKVNSDMATEKMKLMLSIRKVLTPDQKQRLVQLMQGPAQPGPSAGPGGGPGMNQP